MILFYLLIAVLPLSDNVFWARSAGMTMIKYLGVACALYACFYVSVRQKGPNVFRTWQARGFALLYAMMAISYFSTPHAVGLESSVLMIFTSLFGLVLVTVLVVDSLERLRWTLLCVVASVTLASAYALRQWQHYHNVYTGFRPGGLTGDSNYFSLWVLMCLPVAFAVMVERRHWQRAFAGGCFVIMLVAFTLAASRGAFLGMGAAFVFLVWRSRYRARNLIIGVASMIVVNVVSPFSPLDRLLHPNYGDKLGQVNRMVAWKAGLDMIRQHPVVGIGVGNFKVVVDRYQNDSDNVVKSLAHNTYLEIAAEMGVPALLLFLAILYLSFRTAGRVCRRTLWSGPRLLHHTALNLQASLVGGGVALLFLSAQHQKILWLVVSLTMCLPLLIRRVKRTECSESSGPDGVGLSS